MILVVNADSVIKATFITTIGKTISVGNADIAGAQTNTITY